MAISDYDILLDPIFSLPLVYKDGNCEEVLISRLKKYHEFLYNKKIGGVPSRYCIDSLIKYVEEMFENYYLGQQNKAYEAFKKALNYDNRGDFPIKIVLPKESMYRARVNKEYSDYGNDEMFHIKFGQRNKVETQRFSFPGLPCLYLSSSVYVCWAELDKPSWDRFQVAEICQKDDKKNLMVIDLGIPPKAFYDELKKKEKEEETIHKELAFEQYLRWWPIMAACTMAVKEKEKPFKPEYIFSQFFLQYLLESEENSTVGIKFLSTKVGQISEKHYKEDYRTYTNYVMPVRSLGDKDGFCKVLSENFEIKNNISGKELNLVSDMLYDNGIKWEGGSFDEADEKVKEHPLDAAVIYMSNGDALLYGKSRFRKIEKILSGEVTKELTSSFTLGFQSEGDVEKSVEKAWNAIRK